MKFQFTRAVFLILIVGIIVADIFFLKIPAYVYAVAAILFFAILAIGSSLIQLNFHLKSHTKSDKFPANSIAITFDDGPSENTSKILYVLEKYNAKATFFCIGKNIEAFPQIAKQIFEDGHILGNHSYSHSKTFGFFRKDKLIEEIQRTDMAIKSIIGRFPKYFRPPYGVTNPSIAAAIKSTKHEVIGWNVRSMDGIISDEKKILKNILMNLKPGAIILLHDTKPHTVNALEQLLIKIRERNLNCITIEEMFDIKAYEN